MRLGSKKSENNGSMSKKKFIFATVIGIGALTFVAMKRMEAELMLLAKNEYQEKDLNALWRVLKKYSQKHNDMMSQVIKVVDSIKDLTPSAKALFVIHGAFESGYYNRCPGGCNNSYNFWGRKAKKGEPFVYAYTYEIINGEKVRIKAKFRKYSSIREAVEDLLNTTLYNPKTKKRATLKDILLSSKSLSEYAKKLKQYRYYTLYESTYRNRLYAVAKKIVRQSLLT